MQTGTLSLLICLSLAIPGCLMEATDNTEVQDAAKATDNMEVKDAAKATDNMEVQDAAKAAQETIQKSQSLCAAEQDFINQRKMMVQESLNNLGMNCSADDVPHIALLPSGGGQRAAVGMLGTVHQMGNNGLLDCLLYIGGVSGSTWTMSSLYSDPEWSCKMNKDVSELTVPGVELKQALDWLNEKAKTEDFSLSDVWGLLTSAGIMKQMDLRQLSVEAGRNATNPYPIYNAAEQGCLADGPIEGKWFEVTPHQAGFTDLGLFIETPLLGSKFQNGQLLESRPEMDMIQLQGVLGSAMADMDSIKDVIPSWLKVNEQIDSPAEEYFRINNALNNLVNMIRCSTTDAIILTELDVLHKIVEDMVHVNRSTLLESKNMEERKSVFQQWKADLLTATEAWCQNQGDGPWKSQATLLNGKVIPLIIKWEWGTTRNFLYQCKDAPNWLSAKEELHLVDAGLVNNVCYPPFLGEKRDMDLLIVPEFSAGQMFETLTQARDYAAALKKPFPEIDEKILEEREWPKACYVFEGKEKEPTIVYMPLFNRENCKDAEEVAAKMKEFSTFQFPYSEDKIKSLMDTVSANMNNNKETLLREINKSILHRQNKRNPSADLA